jgi:hypothetical protein
MDLLRFNAEDIHELRVQLAEHWRSMPPGEAERDYHKQAEEARAAIEAIRAARNEKAV